MNFVFKKNSKNSDFFKNRKNLTLEKFCFGVYVIITFLPGSQLPSFCKLRKISRGKNAGKNCDDVIICKKHAISQKKVPEIHHNPQITHWKCESQLKNLQSLIQGQKWVMKSTTNKYERKLLEGLGSSWKRAEYLASVIVKIMKFYHNFKFKQEIQH